MPGIDIDNANVENNISLPQIDPGILPEGSSNFDRPNGIATFGESVGNNILNTALQPDVLPEGDTIFEQPHGIGMFGESVGKDITLKPLRKEEECGTVTASAATLLYIPGENENVSQGGYPLDSGLIQGFPEGMTVSLPDCVLGLGCFDVEVQPVKPVLDAWLKGDATMVQDEVRPGNDELPVKHEDARKKVPGKYSDEAGDAQFGIYRIENRIKVSFETEDCQTIDSDSVEIEFSEKGESPDDDKVVLEGRDYATTATPDHEVNGIPVDDWHGGEFTRESNRQKRYYTYDDEFEFDGVEGVRVLTVNGGYAGFVEEWAERVSDDALDFFNTVWGWDLPDELVDLAWYFLPQPEIQHIMDFMVTIPNTYSVIEFIVLADGRRYFRVWDASQYPSMAVYVDGERRDQDKMEYEPRELIGNFAMGQFFILSMVGMTPYYGPLLNYVNALDSLLAGSGPDWLEEAIEDALDQLPRSFRWQANEIMPEIPRSTLAFDADGQELENPDEPFTKMAEFIFPLTDTIDPKN